MNALKDKVFVHAVEEMQSVYDWKFLFKQYKSITDSLGIYDTVKELKNNVWR